MIHQLVTGVHFTCGLLLGRGCQGIELLPGQGSWLGMNTHTPSPSPPLFRASRKLPLPPSPFEGVSVSLGCQLVRGCRNLSVSRAGLISISISSILICMSCCILSRLPFLQATLSHIFCVSFLASLVAQCFGSSTLDPVHILLFKRN